MNNDENRVAYSVLKRVSKEWKIEVLHRIKYLKPLMYDTSHEKGYTGKTFDEGDDSYDGINIDIVDGGGDDEVFIAFSFYRIIVFCVN